MLISINRKFFVEKHPPFDAPSLWLKKIINEERAQIVQIGSNDGVSGDPIFELVQQNLFWKALFVEPVPYLFDKLKRNYGNSDRFLYENAAINDGSQQTFFVVNEKEASANLSNLPDWYDQLGSFDRNNIVKHLDGILEPYIEEIELQGITLKFLLEKNRIDYITLLHIDAEGHDWKILSQLDLHRISPKVILIEHKHLTLEEKESLRDFLKTKYEMYRLGSDLLAVQRNYMDHQDISSLRGELIIDIIE